MLHLAFGFRRAVRAVQLFLALAAGLYLASAPAAAFLTGIYQLPASIDPTVTSDLATELFAEVVRPDTGGPFPLQPGAYRTLSAPDAPIYEYTA